MPLENLTPRERLALDLEHTTENLWVLVDRDARKVGEADAPTTDDLNRILLVLRVLDGIGAELAPDLYRRSEKRRGRRDIGPVNSEKG